MSDWVRVEAVADFPEGESRLIDVDGVRVAVFHLAEGFFAVEDVCTHDGGELTGGELNGHEITCPRHGARFDIRTGAVLAPPAYEDLAVLPTRVEDGWLQVRDDRWS
jgi:3-phenylpropionate/trans-cinnamate dioxygenase ferredoxin subunit